MTAISGSSDWQRPRRLSKLDVIPATSYTVMSSDDLTKAPLQTLQRRLFPGTNYLFRLKDRLRELGIHHNDELHAAAIEAYEASLRLSVLMHHLNCEAKRRSPRK